MALAYPGRQFCLPAPESTPGNGPLSPAESAARLLFGAVWEPGTRVCPFGPARFLPPGFETVEVAEADVLAVADHRTRGALVAAQRGTEDAPERGAAVLYVLTEARARTAVRLSGPGIHGSLETEVPLPPVELLERNEACNEWPLGVDVIVIDEGARVLALPRTTRVEVLD
jgi:alpha-D-ribose 1-methylphosphonate 5-triphosphate synthase subunit PhnH